jgi:hypothetical protein
MNFRWIFLGAFVATVIAASSQARADYEIIRWSSGVCEILDRSIPMRPLFKDYKAGRQTFRTYGQAMAFKGNLLKKGECSF